MLVIVVRRRSRSRQQGLLGFPVNLAPIRLAACRWGFSSCLRVARDIHRCCDASEHPGALTCMAVGRPLLLRVLFGAQAPAFDRRVDITAWPTASSFRLSTPRLQGRSGTRGASTCCAIGHLPQYPRVAVALEMRRLAVQSATYHSILRVVAGTRMYLLSERWAC